LHLIDLGPIRISFPNELTKSVSALATYPKVDFWLESALTSKERGREGSREGGKGREREREKFRALE